MSEEQSSYRQIMKATSLFGGVQVFNIVFAIIRSKIVAMLLGPAGMGVAGLLTSTTGLIGSLTNFGIGSSAVKDIAAANATNDESRISLVVSVFRRIVWITGLLGLVVMIVLSPVLSEMTFGNRDYTLAFIWLSVTLLFGQLSSGQMVLLQGMRKLQYLAKANMAGTVIGLVVSAPLYFWLGVDGIVPAIIISSVCSMVLALFYGRKVAITTTKVTTPQIIAEGKGMVKMGIMLSLSGLISTGAAYLLRIYISNEGGVEQVGLFNAGFAIINTYVGMVFTAMGTDYYPRLSAITDKVAATQLVNQQGEIALLILSPILLAFILFGDLAILILYSKQFVPVLTMVLWAALGMYFKALSWTLGFMMIARGDSKLFFMSELSANIYLLVLNILGYYFWGLTGLGISFLIAYMVLLFQVFMISKYKYSFKFRKQNILIALISIIIGSLCFLSKELFNSTVFYIFGSALLIANLIGSFYYLEKETQFIQMFKNKFRIK